LPSTRVERIRREGQKWALLTRHNGGGSKRIEAETVFVCGGAVQTPALLRRSGIKQNVGRSLQLHPTIKVTARFNDIVNAAEMGVPVHQVKQFAPGLSFGCSISTPPHLALGLLDYPAEAIEVRENWSRMANYYAMITPEGRGTVDVLPGFSDSVVRFQLTTTDRRALTDGLRKLCHLLFEAGAVKLCPTIAKSRWLLGPDDLKKLPEVLPNGLSNLMTIHLFSSCPMGEDKAICVTDSFGRMHGFKNLFLADASLLCTAPGVNPQGTIMALARRNAEHFLVR
jgi:choline dehydrogenase-like flavoprotein